MLHRPLMVAAAISLAFASPQARTGGAHANGSFCAGLKRVTASVASDFAAIRGNTISEPTSVPDLLNGSGNAMRTTFAAATVLDGASFCHIQQFTSAGKPAEYDYHCVFPAAPSVGAAWSALNNAVTACIGKNPHNKKPFLNDATLWGPKMTYAIEISADDTDNQVEMTINDGSFAMANGDFK